MAALQNEALQDLDGAKAEMTGQDYSYISSIQTPESKGVGSEGSFGQVSKNIEAAFDYVGVIGFTDNGLGDSYLLNTGGSCVSPSGTLENRYNYVDNRPTKKLAVNRSLISGIMDDIGGMNPLALFKAVKASGAPACQKYKCEVTNQVNGDTQYITPFLSPDFNRDKCKQIPEPADPQADIQQKIDAQSSRVKELQTLVASNPDNEDLKAQLSEQQNVLSEMLQTKLDMANRKKEYDTTLSKETFEVMNSPLLGGVLLAGILLATLVFRR